MYFYHRPYSFLITKEGGIQPVPIAADAAVDPGLPRSIRTLYTLLHNEVVCAVAISYPVRHIYTGGKVYPPFLLCHRGEKMYFWGYLVVVDHTVLSVKFSLVVRGIHARTFIYYTVERMYSKYRVLGSEEPN